MIVNAENIRLPAGSPGISLASAIAALDEIGQTGWLPLFGGQAHGCKTEGQPNSSYPLDRYAVECQGVLMEFDGHLLEMSPARPQTQ